MSENKDGFKYYIYWRKMKILNMENLKFIKDFFLFRNGISNKVF